jgi:hypothetical protein
MIEHTLRHGDEFYRLIIKGMLKNTRVRRPRIKYINQIMQDASLNFYRELRDMSNDRVKW